MLAIAKTPPRDDQDEPDMSSEKKPKPSVLLRTLGIPRTTGLRQFKTLMHKRRLIRIGDLKSDWELIISRNGFYQKIPPPVRLAFDKWVRDYHMVIHSPLARDSVRVPDPSNP